MNRSVRHIKILFNFIILTFKIFGIVLSSIPIYKNIEKLSLQVDIILCILFIGFFITIIFNIYNIFTNQTDKEFGKIYNFKIILYTSVCVISIYLFILDKKDNYPIWIKNDIYILCSIVFGELIILGILNIIFCLFTNENDNKILPF